MAGHEFFHVLQYANDPNFTAKYLLNFVANLADAALFKPLADIYASGIGQEAYEKIDYEKKANEFEGQIDEDIKKNGNPCDPNSVNGKKYGR